MSTESNEAPGYDFWREYPDHDPQSIVWYPLSYGPVDADRIWPRDAEIGTMDSSFYLHVPFCAVVCPFCPFNKFRAVQAQMARFVDAVKREISQLARRRSWNRVPLRAGFFGGGTPTALSGDQLVDIIEHLRRELTLRDDIEFSVEGSPETITLEKLRILRAAGVNRFSFGVQSFDDTYLRRLGRGHDAATARRTIDLVLEAGFDNVAIDLLYRLPGQTLDDWQRDLEAAVASGVHHVSAYSLFIEPGSPLARIRERGKLVPVPDEETDLEMFRLTIEVLGAAGIRLYTLYDFAAEGKECLHHLVNWQAPQQEFVGIGPGAFSFVRNGEDEFVYGNRNPLEDYFTALGRDELPIEFGTELTIEEKMARYMVLGVNGQRIPKVPFRERFGVGLDEAFGDRIARLVGWGLVENRAEELALTPRGQLYIANVGKEFCTEKNRRKPHPAGVDLQRGGGPSTIGIELGPPSGAEA